MEDSCAFPLSLIMKWGGSTDIFTAIVITVNSYSTFQAHQGTYKTQQKKQVYFSVPSSSQHLNTIIYLDWSIMGHRRLVINSEPSPYGKANIRHAQEKGRTHFCSILAC